MFNKPFDVSLFEATMRLIGDIAKAILILAVVSWIYLIIEFVVMEQNVIALFLSLASIIPLSMIVYERRKCRKRAQSSRVAYS